MLKAFLSSDDGQGLVEYALIIALVSVVAIVALQTLGTKANNTLNNAAGSLELTAVVDARPKRPCGSGRIFKYGRLRRDRTLRARSFPRRRRALRRKVSGVPASFPDAISFSSSSSKSAETSAGRVHAVLDALGDHEAVDAIGREIFHVSVEQARALAVDVTVAISNDGAHCGARSVDRFLSDAGDRRSHIGMRSRNSGGTMRS